MPTTTPCRSSSYCLPTTSDKPSYVNFAAHSVGDAQRRPAAGPIATCTNAPPLAAPPFRATPTPRRVGKRKSKQGSFPRDIQGSCGTGRAAKCHSPRCAPDRTQADEVRVYASAQASGGPRRACRHHDRQGPGIAGLAARGILKTAPLPPDMRFTASLPSGRPLGGTGKYARGLACQLLMRVEGSSFHTRATGHAFPRMTIEREGGPWGVVGCIPGTPTPPGAWHAGFPGAGGLLSTAPLLPPAYVSNRDLHTR